MVDLVGRALLLDPAVVHDDDAIGELERLLLVVRDEHAGHVQLVVEPAQPAAQVLAHLRVERAERLVEQQHPRLDRERAGERHALALAARELVGIAGGEAAELHEVEQLAHPVADLAFRRPRRPRPHPQPEGDVLEDRHVAEQRVVLEDEADVPALRAAAWSRPRRRGSTAPCVGHLEAGDDAQQRRLAGAGRAEQRDQLAGRHGEVDAVEHADACRSA